MSELPPPDPFSDDLLDRKPFCGDLERFLLIEQHFVDGGLVVSLNGSFGSGKTTFLNMWAQDLTQRRKDKPDLPRPVVVNAWESDYCGDPLIALISALSQALEDKAAPSPEPKKAAKLREAAKDIGWFSVGLANSVVSNVTGADAVAAAELAEEKKTRRREVNQPPVNILEAYETKRAALEKLKAVLTTTFGGPEPKAFVFIDELDRCRPDYAVGYLETIKHIFDIHGIVFVLAVDEAQLKSATTVLFGEALVFSEYYRKFSQRTINLPGADKVGLSKLSRDYVRRYLQAEAKRWCIYESQTDLVEHIVTLLVGMKLHPRQIQEVFRILGHALSMSEGRNMRLSSWTFGVAILYMGALRVANREAYNQLGLGMLSVEKLAELLKPLDEGDDNGEWWFQVLVTGMKRDENWENSVVKELVRNGWIEKSAEQNFDVQNALAQFNQSWGGRYGSQNFGLNRVYQHIERLTNFTS